MKKFINSRVLPFVCVLSVLVSVLIVPASAASGVGKDTGIDTANRNEWAEYIVNTDPVFKDLFASQFGVDLGYKIFFRIIDDVVGKRYGEVELDVLHAICAQLNDAFCNKPISDLYSFVDVLSAIGNYTLVTCFRLPNVNFEVVEGGATAGYYRIQDTVSGLFITNAVGLYPCTPVDGEFTDTDKHNHWISKDSAEKNFRYSQVMTGADMKKLCASLQVGGVQAYVSSFGDKYKAIYRDGREVYANPDGYPFLSAADDSEWVVNQSRPDAGVKDENGDILEELPEENTSGIDLSGMTITLPDGSINFIDKIIYDESTKSYHIDSHDTYNYEINNYYTWNYYINYTSITYIGQTEEYNKYYEVYYELPDGRSSADLTKEDLEQLNLSVDVIPYGRSADDTSLRSLYHFDGDTKDSSYWNYCTDFTWNKGASLTYMDAGVFDGALYLDETEHDFSMVLPTNLGSGDFTIQFRYYQSHTEAPVTDTYLKLGGSTVLSMNGSTIRDVNDKSLTYIPVGSWNEIAIMRVNGNVYYYLNGVSIGSASFATVVNNTINFHFGSEQQTFKYFDELRVLNVPLKKGGASYECSSVPHDTNLTLVLPDTQVPVADEYWKFSNSSQTNIFSQYGLDDFQYHDSSRIVPISTLTKYSNDLHFYYGATLDHSNHAYPNFYYFNNAVEFKSAEASSVNVYNLNIASRAFPLHLGYIYSQFSTNRTLQPTGGIHQYWGVINSSGQYFSSYAFGPSLDKAYTFSMVDMNGNIGSVTFDPKAIAYPTSGNAKYWTTLFNGYYIGWVLTPVSGVSGVSGSSYALWLSIQPAVQNVANDFLYLELVEGSSTNLSCERVSAVTAIDKDDLNTPTLAVRTDIDITSYQIGGVRPSLPEKGMVWAMVENERVTSLQVYNGQAWEGVDGRIWTGERWIPMSSYNIITLQDLYDIVDATPNYEYIYSEAGFWAWWQKSWNAFTERLFTLLSAGGASGGGVSITPETAPAVPDDEVTGEKGYNAIELFVVLKDGTWNFITGIVGMAFDGFNGFVESVSSAGNFFTVYDEDSENSIVFIPLEEGETIWD